GLVIDDPARSTLVNEGSIDHDLIESSTDEAAHLQLALGFRMSLQSPTAFWIAERAPHCPFHALNAFRQLARRHSQTHEQGLVKRALFADSVLIPGFQPIASDSQHQTVQH